MGETNKRRTSIYYDDEFMKWVDEWRRTEEDIPKRNEAIIRMVKESYDRRKKKLSKVA